MLRTARREQPFFGERGREANGEGSILAGLRGAGLLAGAGLVANVANVAATFALSHFLTTRGYGAFNQLVYLFLVLSMPGYAVVVAVVRQVAHWDSVGELRRVSEWIRRWRLACAGIIAAVALTSLLAGPRIATSLSLGGAGPVVPVLTAGAGWLLLSIDRGLLQARRLYGPMARNLIVEGAVRTGGTLALVAAGLGVTGAMVGIFLSAVLADVDARWSLARHRHIGVRFATPLYAAAVIEELEIATSGEAPLPEVPTGHATRDFFTALLSLALLASLAGLDVIVLGRMAPRGSGPYAAIAVVAKVLFFGALILSGYLLPEATTRWHRGEHAFRQLAVTLGFVVAGMAAEELVALLWARRALSLVFPARLLPDSGQMAGLVLAMGFLASTVIVTYYLLGIGRRGVVATLAAGAALLTVLLVRAGGAAAATVHAELLAQGLILAVLGGYLAVVARRVPLPDTQPSISVT